MEYLKFQFIINTFISDDNPIHPLIVIIVMHNSSAISREKFKRVFTKYSYNGKAVAIYDLIVQE